MNKVEGLDIPEDSLLVSLDVVFLYTNIPHDELRLSLQNLLDTRPDPHPPTHFLLDLIDILMEMNYFQYDNTFYLQIRGVAMGSAFAPNAANLFMNMFEQQFILSPANNPYHAHIFKYYRFIDDIFCIYKDIHSFTNFLEWINNLHPTIKFTATTNKLTVNYLDTTVFRTLDNKLAISPFKKEVDKNTYLHFVFSFMDS